MIRLAWAPRGQARIVVTNFAIRAVAVAVEKASRILLVLGAAPVLGKVDFGRYQFALTVTGFLAVFADLGLSLWTTRALARDCDRRPIVVRVGLQLRSLTAVPFLIAVAIGVGLSAPGEGRSALAWLGVAALANAFLDYFGAILRGYEQFGAEARLNVTRALVVTAAGLVALHVGRSITAFVSGLAGGTIGCSLWGLAMLARRTGAFSLPGLRAIDATLAGTTDATLARTALVESAPICLAMLLSLVYFKLDIVVLQEFSGQAEVGLYSAAYKVLEATLILPSVLMATTFPPLARIGHDRDRRRRWELALGAALLTLGTLVGAGVWIWSDTLIKLLFGGPFAASSPSLRILAFAVPPLFLNMGLMQFLYTRSLEWRNLWLSALLVVLNLGLNLVFIPRFAGRGAALATVITEGAMVIGCLAVLGVRGRAI